MQRVSEQDFAGVALGDKRRGRRLATLVNNICEQPGGSISEQSGDWYSTKAAYGFFKNKAVSEEALQQSIQTYGVSQLSGQDAVLVAHDITTVSFGGLHSEGLGYLVQAPSRGIMCYSSVAVSTGGRPLALLYQNTWTRPVEQRGKKHRRKQRPFEQKESYEWYRGVEKVNDLLGEGVCKIHVCDREADIYELFFFAYQPASHLLIRAAQNRRLTGGDALLWDRISALPAAGVVELQLPDHQGLRRLSIEAEVRYDRVEVLRPQGCNSPLSQVRLLAMEVRQTSEKHPAQKQPVHWRLLTNLEVTSLADVLRYVRWYGYRWLIERFHFVLKSGTRIEALQLRKAASLQKAIHVYSIAALQLMKGVYLARQQPEASCELVFSPAQWAVLYMLTHHTAVLPSQPPTLSQAMLWIARLGGYLARKSDGPPGLKTIWLGYRRIADAACLYEILTHENLGKG